MPRIRALLLTFLVPWFAYAGDNPVCGDQSAYRPPGMVAMGDDFDISNTARMCAAVEIREHWYGPPSDITRKNCQVCCHASLTKQVSVTIEARLDSWVEAQTAAGEAPTDAEKAAKKRELSAYWTAKFRAAQGRDNPDPDQQDKLDNLCADQCNGCFSQPKAGATKPTCLSDACLVNIPGAPRCFGPRLANSCAKPNYVSPALPRDSLVYIAAKTFVEEPLDSIANFAVRFFTFGGNEGSGKAEPVPILSAAPVAGPDGRCCYNRTGGLGSANGICVGRVEPCPPAYDDDRGTGSLCTTTASNQCGPGAR